jgi:hypothetical protein
MSGHPAGALRSSIGSRKLAICHTVMIGLVLAIAIVGARRREQAGSGRHDAGCEDRCECRLLSVILFSRSR